MRTLPCTRALRTLTAHSPAHALAQHRQRTHPANAVNVLADQGSGTCLHHLGTQRFPSLETQRSSGPADTAGQLTTLEVQRPAAPFPAAPSQKGAHKGSRWPTQRRGSLSSGSLPLLCWPAAPFCVESCTVSVIAAHLPSRRGRCVHSSAATAEPLNRCYLLSRRAREGAVQSGQKQGEERRSCGAARKGLMGGARERRSSAQEREAARGASH
jgi:hypothetical protein